MEVCKEKHDRIDEKLSRIEERLNRYGGRLDKLEQFRSSTETEMRNLVLQISSLVSTIKWFLGLMITSLFTFFIWYIQNL